MTYGVLTIDIEDMIKKRNISKLKLAQRAEMSTTQINKIIKHETTRIDLATLARLCTALDCDVSDILIYKKPDNL